MTAREMFEQLGYELEKEYTSDGVNDTYRYNKCYGPTDSVIFCLECKEIVTNQTFHRIHLNELQAIIQQCKELGWLEEEKKEIKQETNFEHYKDRILDCCIDNLAVVKGIPKPCSKIDCNDCDFLTIQKECCEIAKDWLKQPYKKLTYKLNKFEFDLIQTYRDCHESCKFSEFKQFIELKDKGYLKDIDLDLKIHEILSNCEVIK